MYYLLQPRTFSSILRTDETGLGTKRDAGYLPEEHSEHGVDTDIGMETVLGSDTGKEMCTGLGAGTGTGASALG